MGLVDTCVGRIIAARQTEGPSLFRLINNTQAKNKQIGKR